MLNYETYGINKTEKPILIVHGLFGSHKNWRTIAKALVADGRFVITADMRNHGHSFWSDEQSYQQMATDLIELIDIHGGSVDIIGHSMGGKVAMTLALMSSEHVSKLIVVDISPVRYYHSQLKHLEAMAGLNLKKIKSRKDAENQLSEFIPDLNERLFLIQNLNFSDINTIKWNINLGAIRRNLPQLMNFPDFKEASNHSTLFIKGSLSNYILEKHSSIIQKFFPNYQLVTVEGAGHWLQVDKKEDFVDLIISFLSRKV